MESPFAYVLDRRSLPELAGERFFGRGEDCYLRGAVRSLIEYEGTLTARVLGTHEYRVKLLIHRDGGLSYSCGCPVGADGLFCKHCVAVGLAWLGQRTEQKGAQEEGGGQGLAVEEIKTFLEGQDKNVLVRLLLERAMEDERLYGRLLMRAARTRPEGVDLAAFRKAIDDAFCPGDLPDYGSTEHFTRAIGDVVESISELLEEGLAKETIELCEHALEAAEGAMDYDVDGYVSGALEELEGLHHAACEEAKADQGRWRGDSSSGSRKATTTPSSRRRTLTPTSWKRRDRPNTGGSLRSGGHGFPCSVPEKKIHGVVPVSAFA